MYICNEIENKSTTTTTTWEKTYHRQFVHKSSYTLKI